jgi:hypothetical protein
VTSEIVDLPAGYLGITALGASTIEISANAAGYGWYIGTTDSSSPELVGKNAAAATKRTQIVTPAGHEDLLTVVMHELGHTLGLKDLRTTRSSADLMAESLATGVRRLPSAADVATVVKIDHAANKALPGHGFVDAVLGNDQKGTLTVRVPSDRVTTGVSRQQMLRSAHVAVHYSAKSPAGDSRLV